MSQQKIQNMFVRKRNGNLEEVSFDKILTRVKSLGHFDGEEPLNINYSELTIKVIDQLYDSIGTSEIDELTAEQCASLTTQHPDFGKLATRVIISNHQKNTSDSFTHVMNQLYNFKDIHDVHHPMISKRLFDVVSNNSDKIDKKIVHTRDFNLDYFGIKTLERAYLMKINGVLVERPQYMWMRVALGIHMEDLEKAFQTYDLMSEKYFTHATPTLFNAGTPRPQMSSCYLLAMESDSIKGIYNTLSDCASISKWAGGIGLHIHNIRATGSHIRGTNGTSNGIVPMLRVFNNTARYCDQGGGKRNGSFAMYLEPWHADIEDFREMKKNHGDEEIKARDLFYALWIPDLFMERVRDDGDWTLMCPDKCPGLSDVYSDKFNELYKRYESEGKGNKTMKARKLWFHILDSQIETGTPYILYKDSANEKSNQKNLGTIKSSNLCTEIIEYSDDKETAVCNLASIGLSKFVQPYKSIEPFVVYGRDGCVYCKLAKYHLEANNIRYTYVDLTNDNERQNFYKDTSEKEGLETPINTMPQIYIGFERIGGYDDLIKIVKPTFDYEKLHDVTKVVTHNLNKVIDLNFYPTDKTCESNMKNRPIGIGVQGLADVLCMMNLPFDSQEAREINKNIFETIYHGALESSMEESKQRSYGMGILKDFYNKGVFSFVSDKPFCKEYNIDMNTLGSQHGIVPIRELLDLHLPTRAELELPKQYLGSYSTIIGSPISTGVLQFDEWGVSQTDRYDWDALRSDIINHGIRNSLLLAPMPTASTSQILGNNECFEPFTSNIYLRRTLAGEFVVINKHLLKELIAIDLWDTDIKNNIIYNKGSVQGISQLPKCLKEKYKIVWEIPMKSIIDMAADRGPYICQSQSMNLWMENPDYKKLTAMHLYSWKKGLKTGMYYLRTKAKASAQQFTIEPTKNKKINEQEDDEECLMCSG